MEEALNMITQICVSYIFHAIVAICLFTRGILCPLGYSAHWGILPIYLWHPVFIGAFCPFAYACFSAIYLLVWVACCLHTTPYSLFIWPFWPLCLLPFLGHAWFIPSCPFFSVHLQLLLQAQFCILHMLSTWLCLHFCLPLYDIIITLDLS